MWYVVRNKKIYKVIKTMIKCFVLNKRNRVNKIDLSLSQKEIVCPSCLYLKGATLLLADHTIET